MPKRKRSSEISVEETFRQGCTALFRVLKSVKGLERQRQSKRLQDGRSTPEKIGRIEKEVAVLKALDLHQSAHAHLVSSLLKVKGVAELPELPEEVKKGIPRPDISEDERKALHNVTSSLYNYSEVRDVVERAVSEVCAGLGVSVSELQRKGRKRKNGDAAASIPEGPDNQSADRKSKQTEERKSRKPRKEADDHDEMLEASSESGAEEAAMAKFASRLASSSDEEGPDTGSESDSSVPEPISRPKQKRATKPATTLNSTFLPNLMGGYISGDESASEIDDAPPRKNRRGQRARQAIWEKKHGEKAKHLQRRKDGRDSRDAGWDPIRGAVGPEDAAPWKRGIRKPLERRAQGGTGGRQAREPEPKQPKNTGPLHPSWEASKNAKQTAAYEGKKVVFD